jgi:hypothetical protein
LKPYAFPATRDPTAWPFAAGSPWNTPIGSGAAYAPSSDPSTSDLTTDGGAINLAVWSEPVYIGASGDPLCNAYGYGSLVATWSGGSEMLLGTLHCPASAMPDNTSDGPILLVDAIHAASYELGVARKVSGGWQADFGGAKVDLKGAGINTPAWRAYSGSALGGLIRRNELASVMPHSLAFAIDSPRQRKDWMWPAYANDYRSDYAGHLPMGTLAAIPPDVNLCSLGLSAPGLVMARALQDYGAYLVDSSTGLAFYADESMANDATQSALVNAAQGDLRTLVPLLRVVTNSSETAVAGGGSSRRAPVAPAFQ